MFDKLEGKIEEYKENHPASKVDYQLYDPEQENPLVISILTPLMDRVHKKVTLLVFCVFKVPQTSLRLLDIFV